MAANARKYLNMMVKWVNENTKKYWNLLLPKNENTSYFFTQVTGKLVTAMKAYIKFTTYWCTKTEWFGSYDFGDQQERKFGKFWRWSEMLSHILILNSIV